MDKTTNYLNPQAYVIFGCILSVASIILFITMILTPTQTVTVAQYLSPALIATFSAAWNTPIPQQHRKFGPGQSIVLPSGIIVFNIFFAQMGFSGSEILTAVIGMIAIFILTFFAMRTIYANNPSMHAESNNGNTESNA